MTNKKMTYSQALEIAIAATDGEAKERLIALKAAVDKRNSADKKPTKTQKENEALKAEILNFLADGEKRTITEIIEGVTALHGVSNQKATALVVQLKKEGKISREEIKRKAYFSLA